LASHHDDWDVHGSTEVAIRVSGLDEGRSYAISCRRIDNRHGNAHTAWQEMGSPRPLSEAQRARLQDTAQLQSKDLVHVPGGREWTEFSLPVAAHSVCLVTLTPAE
jgi:beta-xylosidase